MLLGFLLVLLVLVCIALGVVILLQRSEGGALGMGGGPSGFMTARGAGDLLTTTTSILAGVFFFLCLLLTVLSGRMHSGGSVVDRLKVDALNPDTLNRSLRPAAPTPPPPAAAAPGGSVANIGAVTPPPSASFEAPAPQVHTAPAATPQAVAKPRHQDSTFLGVPTAPQSSPTLAPLAKTPSPAPVQTRPAAGGNSQGGQ